MPGAAEENTSREPITSSWLSFAGLLVSMVGFLNIVDGLTALLKKDYYLVTSIRLLAFSFTAWGWIWLIVGISQLVVGGAILARQKWARTAGITLAELTIIGQLAFMNAFPLWSLIVIVLCVVIIYGLMVPPSGSVAL